MVEEILPTRVVSRDRFNCEGVPSDIRYRYPGYDGPDLFAVGTGCGRADGSDVLSRKNYSTYGGRSIFVVVLGRTRRSDSRAVLCVCSPGSTGRLLARLRGVGRIPKSLAETCRSTLGIDCSGSAITATIVSGQMLRDVLGGFLNRRIGKRGLSGRFRRLPRRISLTEPLRSLDRLTRPNDTFCRVLSLRGSVSRRVTSLLVRLLRDLVRCLFILPGGVRLLRRGLGRGLR